MRQILMKALALLGLCGVFVVSWNCRREGSLEALTCEPRDISFGEVVVGSESEITFEVENPSGLYTSNNFFAPSEYLESTVTIDGFHFTNCDALRTPLSINGPFPLALQKNETSELTVQFAPTVVGEWECVAIPQYRVAAIGSEARENFHTCTMNLKGYTASAPGPVCALQPGPELEFGEVDIGSAGERTLTIQNETQDIIGTNRFTYLFDNPSADCRLFRVDPADTVGVIGPGGSREITVYFRPDAAESFECTRSLSSLKEPADPADPSIADACPAEVVMRGTGVPGDFAWRDCSQAGVSENLNGVHGISENEIYTAGDAFTVRASLGACDWLDVPGPAEFDNVNLTDVWVNSDEAWVVGNIPPPPGSYGLTGAILRADISGWSKVDEGWLVTYGAVWGSASENVYFVGTGVSTDFPNAKHWNGSTIDTLAIDWGMSELSGINGTSGDDIWAVLRQSFVSNRVYRFQGTQWEIQTLPFVTKPLHDVWAIQGSGFYAVYAVGEDGAIYHFDGASWTDESIAGETNDFYGVWVSETGEAWVVGENGRIYHKSGSYWSRQNPPAGLERNLMDVWGSSDENVFAVGAGGLILRYAR